MKDSLKKWGFFCTACFLFLISHKASFSFLFIIEASIDTTKYRF